MLTQITPLTTPFSQDSRALSSNAGHAEPSKQKLSPLSFTPPANGMHAQTTTSASSEISKAQNAGEEDPQDTHKDQHSHPQASSSYQTTMLRRWLDRGEQQVEDATKLRDRNDYAKGKAGMSNYLAHWDRAWRRLGRKDDGQRRP